MFDMQIEDLNDLAASASSVFESTKAVMEEISELESPDKLKLLEDLKLSMQTCATVQKEADVFRDTVSSVKEQVLAEDSTITDANVGAVLESDFAKRIEGSTVPQDQAKALNEIDQFISSIKGAPGAVADDGDDDITVTQCIGKLVDPLTRKNIENPVKNKVCGHVYEKTTIAVYMDSEKIRKCPYFGCTNKELRMCDIIEAAFGH